MDGRGRRAFPFGAYFQAQRRTVGFGEGTANTHAYYCFLMKLYTSDVWWGFWVQNFRTKTGKTWFCLSRNLLSTTSNKPFWGFHICRPGTKTSLPLRCRGCCAIQVSKHLVSPQMEQQGCHHAAMVEPLSWWTQFQYHVSGYHPYWTMKQTAVTRLPSMAWLPTWFRPSSVGQKS